MYKHTLYILIQHFNGILINILILKNILRFNERNDYCPMLHICLCDDDEKYLYYYENLLNILAKENNYSYTIDKFSSGESLIFNIEHTPNKYNIIIIDILMKNINGIETAKILRSDGYTGIIIFLTSSKEFALDAYDVEPLSYILKNDIDYKIKKILSKAFHVANKSSTKNIIIACKPNNKVINLNSIIYMESINKKIIFHDVYGDYEKVNISFKEIESDLYKKGFIRCHRSYIINIRFIKTFNRLECNLKNGVTLPIGRKYLQDFRNSILSNEIT